MDMVEITTRTKQAVRAWAGSGGDRALYLDHRLEDLRAAALRALRVHFNEAFRGEPGFPIDPGEWEQLVPATVRDLRDEAARRLGVAP
jgi:hypothetical protein